ncbi:peptidase S28 [Jimgerdemannia flammicorona]|uniref:Peptidase S28 n=1 Tax=Jimgerdemannia flammicorona TaxID=994334 RepID=A0A432ZYX6_9FUNG|nr:peptidase S28 [Jimgerdemannia flammicorona]
MRFIITVVVLLSTSVLGTQLMIKNMPRQSVILPDEFGPFYFDQKIDHFNHDINTTTATFRQRYWMNAKYYKKYGPVILYNAGETDAIERYNYIINSTMNDLAQSLHGIMILIEHRYYGESTPFPDYSTENMHFLNTKQALADMSYFINMVKIPTSHVPPWIMYGGSYSGNIAAWMRLKYPDIVFAAVASSAPVEIKTEFWNYYDPIIRYGPMHCIDAIISTVEQVDQILFSNDSDAKLELFTKFGLSGLKHDDDFASWIGYPLGGWQNILPGDNNNEFLDFCKIFDNSTTPVEYMDVYAQYIVTTVCHNSGDAVCISTHNPDSPLYTDMTLRHRAWLYQTCTEYGYWAIAAPDGYRSLVSHKLDINWFQRQCQYTFGHNYTIDDKIFNCHYGGWNAMPTRTIWIDGEYDPWRELSVHSLDAPMRNSSNAIIIPHAVHHWDFYSGQYTPESIKQAQMQILRILQGWLKHY